MEVGQIGRSRWIQKIFRKQSQQFLDRVEVGYEEKGGPKS